METILAPLRAAASRPARRAYLTTFLLASSSIFLLFLSAFIYTLFYINYVPQIGLQAPLYLQYTPSHPPTAHLSLPPSSIISRQSYTVTVHLRLPSSPSNIDIGNFMLHLSLQSALNTTIASSRRPAILTYRSPLLERIDTVVRAPLLVTGWQRQEEKLSVVLLEDTVLTDEVRGVTLTVGGPGDTGAGMEMGVYDAAVEFRARFRGIRWLMYNYRITSFLLGTIVFWGIEVTFMTIVWWGVYSHFSSGGGGRTAGPVKTAAQDSDSEDSDYLRRRHTGYPTPSSTPGLELDMGASEDLYADDEDEPSFSDAEEEELVGVDVPDSGLGSMSESASSSARARSAGEEGQRRRRIDDNGI